MRRMRRLSRLVCLTVALAAPFTSGLAQPRFDASTDLVVVPVVVVDRRGQDVTTLSRDDFTVLEDGRPMAVEVFVPPEPAPGGGGRFVVVVVDNVHTPPEWLWRAKSVATQLVRKVGASDRMAILALSGGRGIDTSSTAVLRAAIDRIAPAADSDVRSGGETATDGLRALSRLAEQLVESPHRRKVLVLIGAPEMFSPHDPSAFADREPQLSPEWRSATERLGAANVTLHVIDPRGFQGRADDFSQSFAVATGGTAWASNDTGRVIDRVWRDAGVYYLLGYRPPTRDRRPHAISVHVGLQNVTVRARRIRG